MGNTRRAIGIGVARAALNVDKYGKLKAEVHILPLRGATGIGARVRYAALESINGLVMAMTRGGTHGARGVPLVWAARAHDKAE